MSLVELLEIEREACITAWRTDSDYQSVKWNDWTIDNLIPYMKKADDAARTYSEAKNNLMEALKKADEQLKG